MTDPDKSNAFGELIGMIHFRGIDPEDAINKIIEADYEEAADRQTYENLVENHWTNNT